jgi:hypothetical protein
MKKEKEKEGNDLIGLHPFGVTSAHHVVAWWPN